MITVGTAGWSLPRSVMTGSGSHLSRYSRMLRGTEINSSFSRAHSWRTYAKWAAATPGNFRFAVKMPATITHDCRLKRARAPLEQFLSELTGLGRKLGPLLVQLPPSLEFESRVARRFFLLIRDLHTGPIALEPRHASWFNSRAARLLIEFGVGRVAADPAPHELAGQPGGWMGLPPAPFPGLPPTIYYRLHGSPRMYWSTYTCTQIEYWARSLKALPRAANVWCIFDNTAGGGAIENALQTCAALQIRNRRS